MAMPDDIIADEAQIWDALRTVIDPEAGESVVDLGLVYRVECGKGSVRVDMTMTSPACPYGGAIAEEAERTIRAAHPAVQDVAVELVYDPPWTPERMSEAARKRFGW